MQGYCTFKPLQALLTESKLIFLAEAFHLSKKHYFFGSKLTFLVVHAHGVIFP
jgi:hypothetical protein